MVNFLPLDDRIAPDIFFLPLYLPIEISLFILDPLVFHDVSERPLLGIIGFGKSILSLLRKLSPVSSLLILALPILDLGWPAKDLLISSELGLLDYLFGSGDRCKLFVIH
jgi:hypothetical protein